MRINAIFAQVLRTPADGSLRTSQPNLLVRREHANRHEFLSPGPTTTAVEQLQKTNCKSLAALPDSNKSSGFLGGKKLLQSFVASIEPCLDAVDINCRASFFPNAYALSCSLQQACEMLRQKSPREQRNFAENLRDLRNAIRLGNALQEDLCLYDLQNSYDLDKFIYLFAGYDKLDAKEKGRLWLRDDLRLFILAAIVPFEGEGKDLRHYGDNRRKVIYALKQFRTPFAPDKVCSRLPHLSDGSDRAVAKLFTLFQWMREWAEADLVHETSQIPRVPSAAG